MKQTKPVPVQRKKLKSGVAIARNAYSSL